MFESGKVFKAEAQSARAITRRIDWDTLIKLQTSKFQSPFHFLYSNYNKIVVCILFIYIQRCTPGTQRVTFPQCVQLQVRNVSVLGSPENPCACHTTLRFDGSRTFVSAIQENINTWKRE